MSASIPEIDSLMEEFHAINAGKKVSWHARYEQISRNFSSIESLNWDRVFNEDPKILGSIINDILKLNVPSQGRPGKRPSLGEDQAREMFSTMIGENYTEDSFSVALRKLAGNTSIRKLSAQFGLDKMLVHRLLNNKQAPSLEHIERIASHYHKDPSYFLEWRVAYVSAYVDAHLRRNPALTIQLFNRLRSR